MRLVKRSDGSVHGYVCVCVWVARQNRKEGDRKALIKERQKKRRCKDKGGGGVEGHRGVEGEDEV